MSLRSFKIRGLILQHKRQTLAGPYNNIREARQWQSGLSSAVDCMKAFGIDVLNKVEVVDFGILVACRFVYRCFRK